MYSKGRDGRPREQEGAVCQALGTVGMSYRHKSPFEMTVASPSNANSQCVGPDRESAGKAKGCEGCPNQKACASGAFSSQETKAVHAEETTRLQESLSNVSHVVLVLSGKGGVGKSTVAAQLSHSLSERGFAVGLLDVDLCGPSAPRMVLGDSYKQQTVSRTASGAWIPIYASNNLAVMSISFLLQDDDQAVVWRGPRKNALIQQFLTEVDWTGETNGLDYLIVDTPPGTSDEHISTVQYLQRAGAASGAVVVTTPEEVSLADVRKELSFCQKTGLPILGIVENMGIYQNSLAAMAFTDLDGNDRTSDVCEALRNIDPSMLNFRVSCDLFNSGQRGATEDMAKSYGVDFWGRLPLDPKLLQACESGLSINASAPSSDASSVLSDFVSKLLAALPVKMSVE